MSIDYSEYDEKWEFISKNVIKDAGNKCELCYAPNHELVVRNISADYPWVRASHFPFDEFSEGAIKTGARFVKIVLTVHHIDGDKKNNKRINLLALCQRCHLRLDLQKHINNRNQNTNTNQTSLEI